MKPTRPATRRHLPTSPFAAPVDEPIKHFEVTDRVTHDRFGLGAVVSVEDGRSVVVDFGSGQLVRVPSPYNKLDKL
jgi:hypothetical protein